MVLGGCDCLPGGGLVWQAHRESPIRQTGTMGAAFYHVQAACRKLICVARRVQDRFPLDWHAICGCRRKQRRSDAHTADAEEQ